MEHFLIKISTQPFSHGGACTMPDSLWDIIGWKAVRMYKLDLVSLGKQKFGYKARPWSVPTQMREVDQEIPLGTPSDQWSDQTSHQNLRVSLDSIGDWDAWMLWANIMKRRVAGKMGAGTGYACSVRSGFDVKVLMSRSIMWNESQGLENSSQFLK